MQLRFAAALAFLSLASSSIFASSYNQTNLVSDLSGMAASTDPNLKDPWGMSFSATSPIWVSDRKTGVSTIYSGTGAIIPLVVTVPPGTATTGPTGQVFAGPTTNFTLNGKPAAFIFDTLGGTVDAWNGTTSATTVATVSGGRFEGLALDDNMLFAADFKSGGGIDVFNSSYKQIASAGFKDSSIPSGYAPYNIQEIGGLLYVEYAKLNSNPAIPVAAAGGGGYVDVYTPGGVLVRRLISNGPLNAPWGIALAPSAFGSFGGDLLVGNFGNGEINAFNPTNGTWLGTLTDAHGKVFVNPGLWALDFGNSSANPDALYFTAGIDNGNDGLFGDIQLTPEPGTVMVAALGLLGLAGYTRQRSKRSRK